MESDPDEMGEEASSRTSDDGDGDGELYFSEAEQIIEQIFINAEEGESSEIELEQDLVIADIEVDVKIFSKDMSFLKEVDIDMPVMRVAGNELIPMSIQAFMSRTMPLSWLNWHLVSKDKYPSLFDLIHESLRDQISENSRPDGVELMNRTEAKYTFERRAKSFLATRIGALKKKRDGIGDPLWSNVSVLNIPQRQGGSPINTPGCDFTVTTNSNGLSVFWSGAYFVSPNPFNHPTSPTASVLQAGTYMFGVNGGAYGDNINWDKNSIVSLPGDPHVHLNF